MLGKFVSWLNKKVNGEASSTTFIQRCSDPDVREDDEHVWILIDGLWHRFTLYQLSRARDRAWDNMRDAPFPDTPE